MASFCFLGTSKAMSHMSVARRLLLQCCVYSLEFVQEALSDLSFVALLHLGGRQQQPHKYRTAIASGAFVKKWKGSLHIVTLKVPSGDFCKLRLHQCFSSNWNVCILEVYSTCWMLFQEDILQRQFLPTLFFSSSSLTLSATWHIWYSCWCVTAVMIQWNV